MGMIYAEQLEYMSVDAMQQTHESEIKILNDIDKLAIHYEMGNGSKEELEHKIDVYIDHVHQHFANEEQLMTQYGFPNFEMHKMAHDMFLADLQYAVKSWKSRGDLNKIINFVRKTPEWIVMHVNSVDAPTADFIARKMQQS